jgi:hypothetical protein
VAAAWGGYRRLARHRQGDLGRGDYGGVQPTDLLTIGNLIARSDPIAASVERDVGSFAAASRRPRVV